MAKKWEFTCFQCLMSLFFNFEAILAIIFAKYHKLLNKKGEPRFKVWNIGQKILQNMSKRPKTVNFYSFWAFFVNLFPLLTFLFTYYDWSLQLLRMTSFEIFKFGLEDPEKAQKWPKKGYFRYFCPFLASFAHSSAILTILFAYCHWSTK